MLAIVSLFTTSSMAFSPLPHPTRSSLNKFRHHSSACMVKRSERAFIEKRLEDAMNNDWRVFRARLVEQERIEASSSKIDPIVQTNKEEKGNRHGGDIGDMFADAISSIFSRREREHGTTNGQPDKIFHGDTVGGASVSDGILNCEDPFVSHEELPILLNSKVSIDKDKWAHTIPHIEPGCVLVANEKLGGVFHQTVVLIIDHSESQGSNGIIINRPLKGNLQGVAAMQNTTLDLSLRLAFSKAPVTYGGPVNSDQFSILHGFGEVEGARKLAPGIFVGGSEALMNEVRMGRLNPKHALFVKGHAAWVAGQLSREIAKGVWYPVSCSSNLILRYAGGSMTHQGHTSDLWSDVMHCLGDEFSSIAKSNAGRGDHRMMP